MKAPVLTRDMKLCSSKCCAMFTAAQCSLPWPCTETDGHLSVWPRRSPFLRRPGFAAALRLRAERPSGTSRLLRPFCARLLGVSLPRKTGCGPDTTMPSTRGAHAPQRSGTHCFAVTLRWRCPAVCVGQHLLCGLPCTRAGTAVTVPCFLQPQLC